LTESTADRHPFVRRPHRTLIVLTFPVLISLVAEPLTGLADTFFIASLGTAPLAGLGIGATLLSSVFWIFNFLGISTQTEVARAAGTRDAAHGRNVCGLALALGTLIGCAFALFGWLSVEFATGFMSSDDRVRSAATVYLEIRLLGGPAILIAMAAFGALRGLQDMRTPLAIALVQNTLNIALDALLIPGVGPIPAFGVAGAAWASVSSQWLGALWAIVAVRRKLGLPSRPHWQLAGSLVSVGLDMFVRTGSLILFILLSTRAANLLGAESGAANQVIRQFWILSALILDAFGIAAQSLIGFFLGARQIARARRVAAIACLWGIGCGVFLTAAMVVTTEFIGAAFLPVDTRPIFAAAWLAFAIAQPANAVAFVTDGIHWGTRDYRFLRNAMIASTLAGLVVLLSVDFARPGGLTVIWIITGGWIALRTAFGLLRIWPGFGASPLRSDSAGLDLTSPDQKL
jgi:MATE family multidrug resistance protein